MVLEMSIQQKAAKRQMREGQLLPDRYPNGELFLCDLGDVALKDDTASMEHPVFALSTKPDLAVREYRHNGKTITITPSVKGLATIHDKDILIFAISQIMEAKNRGEPYNKHVSFDASDFLRFSNRMTNGRGYSGLKDALTRLRGTVIETNIETGEEEQAEGFGLIDSFKVRKTLNNGTVTSWSVTLSDWLFNAIEANEVLTIHKDYFRLRKPLERRIYELARKHCGSQKSWKVSLEVLQKKSGSQTTKKKFKQLLKPIVEFDHLPTYSLYFEGENFVVFQNRSEDEKDEKQDNLFLTMEAYQEAKMKAPTWDVYVLEQEWRIWMAKTDKPFPRNPDKAFIGFCQRWYKNHGKA